MLCVACYSLSQNQHHPECVVYVPCVYPHPVKVVVCMISGNDPCLATGGIACYSLSQNQHHPECVVYVPFVYPHHVKGNLNSYKNNYRTEGIHVANA